MLKRSFGAAIALVALFAAILLVPGTASAAKKSKDPLVVCKFGCKYKSIQKAADKAGPGGTVQIEPGKYKEGVILEGNADYRNLTIEGTSKNAKKVVLNGKNVNTPTGPAQNGIEAIDVSGLTVKNMTVKNYATNGIFLRDGAPSDTDTSYPCKDYLLKNIIVDNNRAYGLFAFGCVGGRMTKSTGTRHGDSAFYIGATPPQEKPSWTKLDKLDAHVNVLGFSGTNSRYVEITKSNFYNNGAGVVPNTLDSEPYEPSATGRIHDNNIFWNNYNYFLPGSKVQTISNGLGELGGQTINFPTGVGIVMLGTTGWVVEDNNIFGNFKWGVANISDGVGNVGDDAIATNNTFQNNQMGRNGADTNAVDFFSDGSGSGNCFQGNVSSTFDPSPSATNANLYPSCPAPPPPASGTGSSVGNGDQFGDLAGYVLTTPPEDQECSWTKHSHPKFKKYKPDEVAGGNCSD